MSKQIIDALRAITERVVALAEDDHALRAELQQLAKAILEVMPESAVMDESVSAPREAQPPKPEEPDVEYVPAAVAVESLWKDAPTTIPVGERDARPQHWTAPDDSDLALIETRCRIKSCASGRPAKNF